LRVASDTDSARGHVLQGLCLGMLAPGACNNSVAIRVLQLDYTSQACPRGKYVWNLWAAEAGEHDLRPAVELLRRLAPTVCVNWVAYYSQTSLGNGGGGEGGGASSALEVRDGFWLVPTPSSEVDSGDAIVAAQVRKVSVGLWGRQREKRE